jgi:hypothetical protein
MIPFKELRKQNEQEAQELVVYLIDKGLDESHAMGMVENASIAVFPYYITDCPGYSGKVMCVIWSDCYSYYQLFIWVGEEMRFVTQNQDYHRD